MELQFKLKIKVSCLLSNLNPTLSIIIFWLLKIVGTRYKIQHAQLWVCPEFSHTSKCIKSKNYVWIQETSLRNSNPTYSKQGQNSVQKLEWFNWNCFILEKELFERRKRIFPASFSTCLCLVIWRYIQKKLFYILILCRFLLLIYAFQIFLNAVHYFPLHIKQFS